MSTPDKVIWIAPPDNIVWPPHVQAWLDEEVTEEEYKTDFRQAQIRDEQHRNLDDSWIWRSAPDRDRFDPSRTRKVFTFLDQINLLAHGEIVYFFFDMTWRSAYGARWTEPEFERFR